MAISLHQIIGGTFEAVEGLYEQTTVKAEEKQAEQKSEITGFQNPRTKEKTEIDLANERQAAITQATRIINQSRAEFNMNEQVRNKIAGMSAVEKNTRLHLNADLNAEHTDDAYHNSELHKQLTEQKAEQEKPAEVPNPAKQPSALEGAFEGRSGSQGSGTANLSSQAVG